MPIFDDLEITTLTAVQRFCENSNLQRQAQDRGKLAASQRCLSCKPIGMPLAFVEAVSLTFKARRNVPSASEAFEELG